MTEPGGRIQPAAARNVSVRLSGPGRDGATRAIALAASIFLASAGVACEPVAPQPGPSGRATSPTPPVPPLVVSYQSPALGYRIQLPAGFRRSDCLSDWASQDATFANEVFTQLTPDEERSQDRGHVAFGGPVAMGTIWVAVSNADGRSALEWAREYGSFGGTERHEAVVIDGHEATRTVVRDKAQLYVVLGDERMHLISVPQDDPLGYGVLDAVARTFRAGPRTPTPTPTPPLVVPAPGAGEAAGRIRAALEARDASRLVPLMTPRCWLEEWMSGKTGRAVQPYIANLSTRFQNGGLRVSVDPAVQVAQQDGPGGSRLFVRSDWTESGRTMPIDLFLREIDGQWYWVGALVRPQ